MTDLSATIQRLRGVMEAVEHYERWDGHMQTSQSRADLETARQRLKNEAATALPDLLRALEARGEPVAWVVCDREGNPSWSHLQPARLGDPDGIEARRMTVQELDLAQKAGAPHKWTALYTSPATPPGTVRVPVGPTEEVISLERECGQLNDMCIAQRKLIEELASMCRRLSYAVKRDGRDALAAQCVQLLKKHELGGSVVRAAAAQEGK